MAIMHIASTPDTVRWGTLPLPGDRPVATVESDDILRIDTVSHEGLLEDQGRDPLAFFPSMIGGFRWKMRSYSSFIEIVARKDGSSIRRGLGRMSSHGPLP